MRPAKSERPVVAAEQLALDLVVPSSYELWQREQIADGRLRHMLDFSGHQRGQVRLLVDMAGGRNAGSIHPAWICCLCGSAELSRYALDLNHRCAHLCQWCFGDRYGSRDCEGGRIGCHGVARPASPYFQLIEPREVA